MKNILIRGLGIVIAAVIIGWFMFETLLPWQRPAPEISVAMTQENIDRGRYMAVNVLQCVDCHGKHGRMDWKALGYSGDPAVLGGRRAAGGGAR